MFNWFKKDDFQERVLKRIGDAIKHTLKNATEIHARLIRMEECNKMIMGYLRGEIRGQFSEISDNIRNEIKASYSNNTIIDNLHTIQTRLNNIEFKSLEKLEAMKSTIGELHDRLDSFAIRGITISKRKVGRPKAQPTKPFDGVEKPKGYEWESIAEDGKSKPWDGVGRSGDMIRLNPTYFTKDQLDKVGKAPPMKLTLLKKGSQEVQEIEDRLSDKPKRGRPPRMTLAKLNRALEMSEDKPKRGRKKKVVQ